MAKLVEQRDDFAMSKQCGPRRCGWVTTDQCRGRVMLRAVLLDEALCVSLVAWYALEQVVEIDSPAGCLYSALRDIFRPVRKDRRIDIPGIHCLRLVYPKLGNI